MLTSRKALLVALVLFSVAVAAAAWNLEVSARTLATSARITSSVSTGATAESGEPDVGGGNKTSSKPVGLPAAWQSKLPPRSVWLRWTSRMWLAPYLGARL